MTDHQNVHFAGPYVTIGGRRRQLCAWCGHVLLDVQLAPGQEHEPWFDVKLVRVEDGTTTRQPYTYGDPLPPGCCALPDDDQYTRTASSGPTTQGIPDETESTLDGCICTENRCDYDDHDMCVPCGQLTEGAPCLANGPAVDPNDGYPVDLCGKHTGNCSNRCLLPAHHDDECDDDPEPEQCQRTPEQCAALGCTDTCTADGPDEAQETRAADWPAEETDRG